jgi:hypothetical protein
MEPTTKKQSVINRSAVKAFALKVSKERRAGKFTRVSEEFLTQVEADVDANIRAVAGPEWEPAIDSGGCMFITGLSVAKLRDRLNERAKTLVIQRVMRHPSLGCTLKD